MLTWKQCTIPAAEWRGSYPSWFISLLQLCLRLPPDIFKHVQYLQMCNDFLLRWKGKNSNSLFTAELTLFSFQTINVAYQQYFFKHYNIGFSYVCELMMSEILIISWYWIVIDFQIYLSTSEDFLLFFHQQKAQRSIALCLYDFSAVSLSVDICASWYKRRSWMQKIYHLLL